MQNKNLLAIAASLILISSCGENSTKTKESETDTVATTPNTTDNTSTTPVTTSITVPEPVQATFRQKYPDVKDVTWSRPERPSTFDWEWSGWPMVDTGDYMARWNWDNTDYWAWYDSENNWIGTVAPVTDFKSLPAAVNNVINKDYSGYTIVSVDKEFDRNRTAYEIDLAKGEDKMVLLVDENGKVIKKKTLTDGQRTKEKAPQ